MATLREIEAGARALAELHIRGVQTVNNVFAPHGDGALPIKEVDVIWRDYEHEAMIAIEAAEHERNIELRENCKHPMKHQTGSICTDGSGKSDWYCPNCGQSGHEEWPARI